MQRTLLRIAAVVGLFLFFLPLPAPAELHTRVHLVADAKGIVPGGHFSVGVVMSMKDGWHTYWQNPGESGLATQIVWTVPEGFTAGETQWPVPEKHNESGDVLTYGYTGVTTFLVPFTAPASPAPGSRVTLRAHIAWLECREICVPGDTVVTLDLPVVSGARTPDNESLFHSALQRLPAPAGSAQEIRVFPTLEKGMVVLRVTSPAGGLPDTMNASIPDFYPGQLADVMIGRTAVSIEGSSVVLRLPLSASKPIVDSLTLHGIVVYGKAHHAVEMAIPLPAKFCAALSAEGGVAPLALLDRTFTTQEGGTGTHSLLLFILSALLGGLILNIMPCVLPVIALKVFGLVKMAGDDPARIRRLGWTFASGILASFLVLAAIVILLQAAGQQVGWGFQFQEPLFVIAMAGVVFAFGLSLFGVFEIRLPSAALSGIGNAVTRRDDEGKGYGASFSEGVFATVLATPCTAPFLGSALGFAFSQPWWVIIIIFTSTAAGMSLPYLILTARPAWLRYLPKPGEWMEAAKQFMGFLMMATLLWLLYILGKQLGMEAVIWTGAFLLSIGFACWLVGRYATLTASRKMFWGTWAAAAIIVVASFQLFFSGAFDLQAAVAGTSPSAEQPAASGIAWTPFSLAGVESDIQGDRPVFIDFTAEWCLTCKVNEKAVLQSPDVVEKFREFNVRAIRADWTHRNPDVTRLLAKFGRSGVPLYVVFAPGKPDAPAVLPEVITKGIVLDAIMKAAGKSTSPGRAEGS